MLADPMRSTAACREHLAQTTGSLATLSHRQKCQEQVDWKRKNSDKAIAFPWA